MTDSARAGGIEELVEQLALASTLCNVTDMAELGKMHGQMAELVERMAERPDAAGASEFCTFGSSLGVLLEGIILETYSDADGVLETLRKAIAEIQNALKSNPDSPPLPQDPAFIQRVIELARGESVAAEIASAGGERGSVAGQDAASPEGEPCPDEGTGAGGEFAVDGPEGPEEYVYEPLIINSDELEYVKSFVTEAYEHLDAAEASVLELEHSPDDQDKINDLFRSFHTIKGMAGFLNLHDISHLTHRAETLIDLARKGQLALTSDHIDLIFNTADILKEQVGSVAEYLENPTGQPVPQPAISEALAQLGEAASSTPETASSQSGGSMPSAPPPPTTQDVGHGGGRQYDQSGSGIEAPAAGPCDGVGSPAQQASAASATTEGESAEGGYTGPERRGGEDRRSDVDRRQGPGRAGAKKSLAVRVDTDKLDYLVNTVGELVIAQAMVSQNPLLARNEKLSKDITQVAKITREIQEVTMSMRMVTLKQTFQKMDRLVRDLSRKAGKPIDFSISGEDTELDKNVIDQIGDPLMHMVRNAVDHGIDPAAERVALGKPERGQVRIHAAHVGGNIIIEISDDGRGLDRDKLIAKGIERGLITPGAQLSDQEVFALIMQPGFSTAEKVTDISGRGVGMDVVKRNIEKLRGKVEIRSEKGKGSQFTISLPLTLAIIDGMIVGVAEERFVIPTLSIEQALRPEKDQIFTVQKRGEMLQMRGELCPLIRLDELFGIESQRTPVWERMVVIVIVDGRRVGIVLDDLIGQQQVVIKNLGDRFKDIEGISGATILGDGHVGLILDASGLVAIDNSHRAA